MHALRRPLEARLAFFCLAILLLNKDPHRTQTVSIALAGNGTFRPLSGPVTVERLSSAQYVWHAAGERGHARPDGPPARATLDAGPRTALTLPPLSITVLGSAR